MLRTLQKEELQRKIERHLEEGTDDLLEEDKHLAEVNMEDLETSSGERHEYWLVAWRAAKKASRLREIQRQMVRNRHGVDRGR